MLEIGLARDELRAPWIAQLLHCTRVKVAKINRLSHIAIRFSPIFSSLQNLQGGEAGFVPAEQSRELVKHFCVHLDRCARPLRLCGTGGAHSGLSISNTRARGIADDFVLIRG